MTQLQGNITHGDWLDTTFTFPRQADPPSDGGAGINSAGDSAVSGGTGGLSNAESPSIWELLTDTSDQVAVMSPLTLALEQMESSPSFRRGQVAGALGELQQALEQVSHAADGDTEVSLPAGTVMVLAHVLLRHMP